MKISVLGLGYVGAVSAACLAKEGHEIIGVDPEATKVDLINTGRSPIIEKDLAEIIEEQAGRGRLRARQDVARCAGQRPASSARRHAGPVERRHRSSTSSACASRSAAPSPVHRRADRHAQHHAYGRCARW
jgi:hypothetical protein